MTKQQKIREWLDDFFEPYEDKCSLPHGFMRGYVLQGLSDRGVVLKVECDGCANTGFQIQLHALPEYYEESIPCEYCSGKWSVIERLIGNE